MSRRVWSPGPPPTQAQHAAHAERHGGHYLVRYFYEGKAKPSGWHEVKAHAGYLVDKLFELPEGARRVEVVPMSEGADYPVGWGR